MGRGATFQGRKYAQVSLSESLYHVLVETGKHYYCITGDFTQNTGSLVIHVPISPVSESIHYFASAGLTALLCLFY